MKDFQVVLIVLKTAILWMAIRAVECNSADVA